MAYEPLPDEYFTSRGITELTDYNKALHLRSVLQEVDPTALPKELVFVEDAKDDPEKLEAIVHDLTLVLRELDYIGNS